METTQIGDRQVPRTTPITRFIYPLLLFLLLLLLLVLVHKRDLLVLKLDHDWFMDHNVLICRIHRLLLIHVLLPVVH